MRCLQITYILILKRKQGVCGGALPPSKDYIIV